jgi:hypothetical protein
MNMDKRITALAAIFLTACAPKLVTLPDGSQGYSIDCSGLCCDIGDCMNTASKVCRGPYRILGQDAASTGGVVMPAGNGGVIVNGIERNMIVSCGK